MSDNKTIVDTMTHELRIDGYHLIKKEQKTLLIDDKTLILVLSHFIDDKSYQVTWIWSQAIFSSPGGPWEPIPQVETDMTEDEVKKFEEDWTNLWDPEITQNDIWHAH